MTLHGHGKYVSKTERKGLSPSQEYVLLLANAGDMCVHRSWRGPEWSNARWFPPSRTRKSASSMKAYAVLLPCACACTATCPAQCPQACLTVLLMWSST